MLLVHGFAGGITTYYVLKAKKHLRFSDFQMHVLWFLGVLGGIFPDFDIVFAVLDPTVEHRRLITHSTIPYALLFVLINLICYFGKELQGRKHFILMANLVFFLGVVSHLVIDYFVGGLSLFSPITTHYFGYRLPFSAKIPQWQLRYFDSPYMVAETIVALWFLDLRKHINSFVGKNLPIFFFVVALLATLFLMFIQK